MVRTPLLEEAAGALGKAYDYGCSDYEIMAQLKRLRVVRFGPAGGEEEFVLAGMSYARPQWQERDEGRKLR